MDSAFIVMAIIWLCMAVACYASAASNWALQVAKRIERRKWQREAREAMLRRATLNRGV